MNPHRSFKILFLCTGNSARSIIAEYLMRKTGRSRFQAFSAGASPKGLVNPYAIRVLQEFCGIDASDARSKSWKEFAGEDLDFVITLCDNARETCPTFPGHPITAHWGIADPVLFDGDENATYNFFERIAMHIQWRLELFCSLPFEELDRIRLEQATREIGEKQPAENL